MNALGAVNFGMQLLSQGELHRAAQVSADLLAKAPDIAPVHALACEVAIAQSQIDTALNSIDRAIEIDGQEPAFQIKKAWLEVVCRQGLRAQETASAAARLAPDNLVIQLEAARILSECGNHVDAESILLNARAAEGKNPKVLSEHAVNQFFLGKTEEAESAISDYLDLQLPVNGRKLLLRAQLRKQTRENNHVEMLKNHLAQPLPEKESVGCYFALAKELEDLGEYAQSFKALKSGAAIQRGLLNFNLADDLTNINDLISTFQPEDYTRIAESGSEDAPIFIVGMARTGTTLVEHIIRRCEGVASTEETNDFTVAMSSVINDFIGANRGRQLTPLKAVLEVDFGDIARKYQDSMLGMLGNAERYLDKTPFNFLYCGLIKKAFPKARILHLVRDPMDTCYAVFKTLFDQSYFYSYDLQELADYYIAYRQLMDHWHKLIPDAILDVRYEELVSDPINVSRRIAEFVGLSWDREMIQIQDSAEPCSTASAAQVRAPINTSSIGLWRNYEAELEPLRARLSAANIVSK